MVLVYFRRWTVIRAAGRKYPCPRELTWRPRRRRPQGRQTYPWITCPARALEPAAPLELPARGRNSPVVALRPGWVPVWPSGRVAVAWVGRPPEGIGRGSCREVGVGQ